MKPFCGNHWQNPQTTAAIHYFQKQPLKVFCKKGVLKKLKNFIEKHLCWSLFLVKLHAFGCATLLKRNSNTFVSTTFLLVCFLSLNKSTCQTRKNVICFTLKALFVLEKIKFSYFGFSNFMTSSNA